MLRIILAATIARASASDNMDEDEIDAWYENEKEKALDAYLEKINNIKERDKVESEYHKKLKEIMKKYEDLYNQSKKEKKLKKISKKLNSFKDKIISFF